MHVFECILCININQVKILTTNNLNWTYFIDQLMCIVWREVNTINHSFFFGKRNVHFKMSKEKQSIRYISKICICYLHASDKSTCLYIKSYDSIYFINNLIGLSHRYQFPYKSVTKGSTNCIFLLSLSEKLMFSANLH